MNYVKENPPVWPVWDKKFQCEVCEEKFNHTIYKKSVSVNYVKENSSVWIVWGKKFQCEVCEEKFTPQWIKAGIIIHIVTPQITM